MNLKYYYQHNLDLVIVFIIQYITKLLMNIIQSQMNQENMKYIQCIMINLLNNYQYTNINIILINKDDLSYNSKSSFSLSFLFSQPVILSNVFSLIILLSYISLITSEYTSSLSFLLNILFKKLISFSNNCCNS